MKKLRIFAIIIGIGILTGLGLFPTGCAVIVPPGGGPRDTLPPILITAAPKDSTLHFKAKQIVLNFDEYVSLDNALTNLIVSPVPKNNPNVSAHLRTVTIKLKDSLAPNTTYSYNFGKALKDVNEGNILKNFTYVFSTGDHLDTDSITGKVILAQTGGVDSSLIVLLHSNLSDTAIYKTPPEYFTRLDTAGRFVFHFLPKKEFNIFVLPESYMKTYADSTQVFAFLDSTLAINRDSSIRNITLYAYQQYPKEAANKSHALPPTGKRLEKLKEQEAKKPLGVNSNINSGVQGLISPLMIKFDKPLKTFYPKKVLLTDTNHVLIKNYEITADPTDTTNSQFIVAHKWEEGAAFELLIPEDAAIDSFGILMTKADTIRFKTKTNHDYATVQLNFPDVNLQQKPVLQLFSADKMVDSVRIDANRKVDIPLMEPGEYNLRILYDTNGDLTWTPGDYKKRLQPEKVITIKKKFNFIVDTENQWDINLQAPPGSDNKPTVN